MRTGLDEQCTLRYKACMPIRILAAVELALLSPAALFMAALVVRKLNSVQYEPAYTAQQIVMWYAGRMWTLWVLLVALPFAALAFGCAVLKHNWNHCTDPRQFARQSLAIAVSTLAAGGILGIVVLHMLAN